MPALIRRHRRALIPGPVLIGFSELFDRAYGNPKTKLNTDGSYPRVTPSRIGYALLPFACPHCGEVRNEAVDPKRRANYRDDERGFYWCPSCGWRYILNTKGHPLEDSLPVGATHAPALVEQNGKTELVVAPAEDGLDSLGAAWL
jgi:hypothetical protein